MLLLILMRTHCISLSLMNKEVGRSGRSTLHTFAGHTYQTVGIDLCAKNDTTSWLISRDPNIPTT